MLSVSLRPSFNLACLLRCRYPFRRHMKAIVTVIQADQIRCCSSQPLELPTADDAQKVYPEKIQNIVAEISKLTLLEVADLNQLLKKTLNISDAPVMAVGAMPAMGQAKEEDDDAAEAVTKTSFTLKIEKFDESKKVPLIKFVKTVMEGMNLVQAKKFVENLPAVVRKDASQSEVEKLKEELTAIGAECSID